MAERRAATEADLGAARLLAVRGDAAGALAVVDELLSRDPDDLEALLFKGAVLLEQREPELAVAVQRHAVAAWPESSAAWNGLAQALHAEGAHDEALEAARGARDRLSLGDNFRHAGSVYLTLVWCLRELRRFREALAAAEEGLERTPDAILAQWATLVEEELAESQKEEC